MRNFLKNKMGIDITQPSTKKGFALLGSGIALATGHPEIFTVAVNDAGVQYGGLLGTAVPLLLGLWETLRNEMN